MSVIYCKERSTGRSATFGIIADQRVNRTFLVKTDSPYDNQLTIIKDPLVVGVIGGFLSPHPSDPFFTRRNISVESSTPYHWILTVPYSTAPVSEEERERSEYPDPVDRPVKMSLDAQGFERYSQSDLDGNPFANSAGDAYPPQVIEDSRPTLNLRRNITSWNANWMRFNNTVNKKEYSVTDGYSTIVIPKGKALIKGLRIGEASSENGSTFYPLTAQLQKKDSEDGWKLSLLDEGFHFLDGGVKKKIMVKDSQGVWRAPAESVPLDGAGGILAQGSAGKFNKFTIREESDWDDLPFWS